MAAADLIFPHHESERAQSEAATGEPFVRHWMHTALIGKDGAKMSKSLGNLVFVDDLRKEWDPMVISIAIIEHHYRTEWEWDDELMPRAAARLGGVAAQRSTGPPCAVIEQVRACLDDDLDTPAAFAAIDAAVGRRLRRRSRPPSCSASCSDDGAVSSVRHVTVRHRCRLMRRHGRE